MRGWLFIRGEYRRTDFDPNPKTRMIYGLHGMLASVAK